MVIRRSICGVVAAVFLCAAQFTQAKPPPTLDELLKPAQHNIVVISPGGKYIAATIRKPENGKNRVVLLIIDRETNKPVRLIDPEEEGEISQVAWLNDERLIVRRAWVGNTVEQYYTDPLFIALNVDGSRKRAFYASIVDTLIDNDDDILVRKCIRQTARGCWNFVQQMDNDARRNGPRIVDGPEINTGFVTDNAGRVRFATRWDDDNLQRIWLRKGDAWEVFNDEAQSGVEIGLIGTSLDSSSAFLLSERKDGPDVIERYDFATGERTVVMSDPDHDPAYIVYSANGRQPIGAAYGLGVQRARFWNPNEPDAKLLRAIEAKFPEDSVWFHSGSRDGKYIVIGVDSDRDPRSFYLFDRASKHMDLIAREKPWLNPESLARSEPIEYVARDGVKLHGYLTVPVGATSVVPPPLVVMPHGGPFDVADAWDYDEETQILAAHGYAVLRVNYRGSGGRGLAFERAGYRQWGLKIMDDIADGTRWAMGSGRIDPKRICIWGSSFGGYAALMGVIREQALYKCAISTAGATNLNITRKWGDTHQTPWGRAYLEEAVGDDESILYEQSPVKHVGKIQVPLLLVHGNHDPRVSFEHARAMVAAMDKAGKPMETFFFGDETHGIYGEENRKLYYERVLKFLRTNLGTN
jgi:dipeptidyl aminopeptidase/acylaminoacyl peptidase